MRINTRNGETKIEITKQEQKELRRAALCVRNIEKFQQTPVAKVPEYLEQLADSLGKPEEA